MKVSDFAYNRIKHQNGGIGRQIYFFDCRLSFALKNSKSYKNEI